RIAEEPEVMWLTDNTMIDAWLGDDAAWLTDAQVLAAPCRDDDDTLAAVMLFRDAAEPFEDSHYELLEAICPVFGSHLVKVINIDQSPIGRTPRSNPATYVKLFDPIRTLFAQLPEAKIRGFGPGHFSFNVPGGRCEACEGDGHKRIEMHFLADVFVTCDVCRGKRFNRETLQVKFKNHSISDVLDLTVEQARALFAHQMRVQRILRTLVDVGLGYIRLGQSAPTLSGGEAQRIKLAKELCRASTGRTLYILDEPTTGLHFADIEKLLKVLNRLADKGNTIIIIEHNLDVVKSADWIIDLGPDGGDAGGEVVAQGPPEKLVRSPASYTGQFLNQVLNGSR
ncbi:MAG TPA: ATP-binding cassette domain-containing protein, partial [bacterium]|nr:ATP-binding cassette domain-containing protein [bacterium]